MIVRSIVHFFYLREYVASSVIAVRVHSSFEVEIGSTFVFILDSFLVVDHFAELFLPPRCFIYTPRSSIHVNRVECAFPLQ